MTVLSLSQVVGLCLNASADPERVAMATAVIFAESGGDTNSVCENVRDPADGRIKCRNKSGLPRGPVLSRDRGLCQFNNLAHPEVSDAAAFDPHRAVGAMFHLSAGFVDFHAWGGYTSGNYRRFLPSALGEAQSQKAGETGPSPITAATGAVGGVIVGAGSAVGSAANGVASVVTSVPDFLGKLSNPHTWVRVLYVLGGAAAIAGGALMLGKDLSPLGDAAAAVGHVASAAVSSAA